MYIDRFWNTKASLPDHFYHNIIFTNTMGGFLGEDTTLTVRHWRVETEGILRKARVRQGGAWRSPYLMVAGERLRYAPSTGRSRGECLQQQ